MIRCGLSNEKVPTENCMFCDYCKGSVVDNGRTITFCTFSKGEK